jgi:hypothetical protein
MWDHNYPTTPGLYYFKIDDDAKIEIVEVKYAWRGNGECFVFNTNIERNEVGQPPTPWHVNERYENCMWRKI